MNPKSEQIPTKKKTSYKSAKFKMPTKNYTQQAYKIGEIE